MRKVSNSLAAMCVAAGLLVVATANSAFASAPTCRSQGFIPNYYAGGYQLSQAFYGVQALIKTTIPIVAQTNGNFSDEAVHLVQPTPQNSGLEVGWYVGYGNQTGTYVTLPHAYATLNGPNEVDGINVEGPGNTSTNYWYTTWFVGNVAHYRVDNALNGTTLWSGTISANSAVPSAGAAIGESGGAAGIPIGPSTLSNIQQLNTNLTWTDWLSMHTCADTGYFVNENSENSVSDS